MLEANEGSHGIASLPRAVTHSTAWHRELTILATGERHLGLGLTSLLEQSTPAGSRKQAAAQLGRIRAASSSGGRYLPQDLALCSRPPSLIPDRKSLPGKQKQRLGHVSAKDGVQATLGKVAVNPGAGDTRKPPAAGRKA